MADGFAPIFRPSGAGHRAGSVPDPGTVPSDYVLRADATWGPAGVSATFLQFGIVELTILPGSASATADVPFSPPWDTDPTVVVSGSDNRWTWAVAALSPTGFLLEGMVSVEANATLTATGSYIAAHG